MTAKQLTFTMLDDTATRSGITNAELVANLDAIAKPRNGSLAAYAQYLNALCLGYGSLKSMIVFDNGGQPIGITDTFRSYIGIWRRNNRQS